MSERATKELILGGAKPRPFSVPALDGAEVVIRPLLATEAEDVQATPYAGIKASQAVSAGRRGRLSDQVARAKGDASARPATGIEYDLAAVMRGTQRAYALAAAYGLVDPAMTLDEVGKSPADVVEQIGKEVMARSGLADGQAAGLAAFRDVAGGPDDPSAAPGGDAAGPDDA